MVIIDNESDNFPYVAFLNPAEPATADRLEYAFHTFSLRNEKCYAPTGDVTFASPNQDAGGLEGGVERLVEAVLQIKTTAVVLSAEEVLRLADSADASVEVGKGIARTPGELRALYEQSQQHHAHEE